MKRWIGFAVLATVLFPAAAWCAEAPPSHRQAAKELLVLAGTARSMNTAAEAMVEAQAKANPAMEPYRDVMLTWMRKYVTYEALEPKLIDLYTESFTEAELRELIAFYKTPVGHKALEKLPELMQKGALMGTELAQQHTDELRTMLQARQDELEKKEKQEKKEGGKPPGLR
jgi:hypothetical protein